MKRLKLENGRNDLLNLCITIIDENNEINMEVEKSAVSLRFLNWLEMRILFLDVLLKRNLLSLDSVVNIFLEMSIKNMQEISHTFI